MLTYVIPTHNRSRFLRRVLTFYADIQCRQPILIADSSSGTERANNEQLVAPLQERLPVRLCPIDAGFIPKCRRILEQVDTPYTVFCADDDFQRPQATERSACSWP